jgi:hypothetical protein
MAGAAGTAMLWWWGNYVDPHDLYSQFTAVARFVEGVPWTTAGFEPIALDGGTPRLRVLGLRGRDRVLLWLQNRDHTWWNVVEKRPIPPLPKTAVTVPGLAEGTWDVQWWDTWKGAVTKRESLATRDGALVLPIEGLERDLAIQITRRP